MIWISLLLLTVFVVCLWFVGIFISAVIMIPLYLASLFFVLIWRAITGRP